jgi:hypothetical protein
MGLLRSAGLSRSYHGPICEASHVVAPQDCAGVGAQGAQLLVELIVGRREGGEDKEFPIRDQLSVCDPLVLPEGSPVASAQANEGSVLRAPRLRHHGSHGGAINDG